MSRSTSAIKEAPVEWSPVRLGCRAVSYTHLDTGIDSIKLGSDIVLSKRLQGTTPVTRSLTIDGNGHTISGAYPGLWFKGMDSGTVSIQNITFDGLKTSRCV